MLLLLRELHPTSIKQIIIHPLSKNSIFFQYTLYILSRTQMADRDEWYFTNNGKFTVKSDYQLERIYPDRDILLLFIGPTVDVLKVFCWKIRCPPKIKYFLWQLISRCVAARRICRHEGCKGI